MGEVSSCIIKEFSFPDFFDVLYTEINWGVGTIIVIHAHLFIYMYP